MMSASDVEQQDVPVPTSHLHLPSSTATANFSEGHNNNNNYYYYYHPTDGRRKPFQVRRLFGGVRNAFAGCGSCRRLCGGSSRSASSGVHNKYHPCRRTVAASDSPSTTWWWESGRGKAIPFSSPTESGQATGRTLGTSTPASRCGTCTTPPHGDGAFRSLSHPTDVLLKNDDQFFLHRSLMELGWYNRWGGVVTVRDEFE
jgi:hypothetical protein